MGANGESVDDEQQPPLLSIDILVSCVFGAGEDVFKDLGLDRKDRWIDVEAGRLPWGLTISRTLVTYNFVSLSSPPCFSRFLQKGPT